MTARLGYLEIPAADIDRARGFFAAVFGWRPEPTVWSGGVHVPLAGAGGDVGCALAEADTTGIAGPLPVVHVTRTELDVCLRRVEKAGGAVVESPRAVDQLGWFARFRDSEGNVWGLWAGRSHEPEPADG